MKSLTFVEIDVDYCSLTYGTSPCTASIPTTGAIKCFNSLRSCQDQENFTNVPTTLRFAIATDYLPKDIPAIPSLQGVSFSPAIISLGQDLGQRASVSVTFEDHKHSDTGPGFDKYLADRPYDPFKQGTFWGKFRARQPYLTGRPLRVIRGLLGQSLAEMDTRHYVIESFNGPTPDGQFTITAKDVLKLAAGDRAQAPRPNTGFLSGPIDSDDTAVSLNPAGIGNAEYPASGYVAIGGKEICAFTRSGNALTLTRAQLGTEAQSHSANDRVQLVLRYAAQKPSAIIKDLLVTYAEVPSSYIDDNEWETEVDSYLDRVYTGTVAEPTSVEDLVSEIIEQAGLAIWWDDAEQKLRLKVIRAVPSSAEVFNDDNIWESTLQSQEQPDRRISQVQTYFGQRNPLEGLDDPSNYRSNALTVNTDAIAEYGSNAIKTIFSRWIPFGGLTIAQRLNGLQLGRFRDPPRRFSFDLFKYGSVTPVLGAGYQLEAFALQDATGAREQVPLQITSLNPSDDRFEVEAEEMRFDDEFLDAGDVNDRVITIDTSTDNVNVRTIHDTLYPAPTTGDAATVTVTCIIAAGVSVGSTSSTTPALQMGSWPAGWDADNLFVVNKGSLRGKPGDGGRGGGLAGPALDGKAGGTAFYTRVGVTFDNDGSMLGGGGGGGGGARVGPFPTGVRLGGGGGGGGRGYHGALGGTAGANYGGPVSGIAPAENGTSGGASTIGQGGNGADVGGSANRGGNGGDGGDLGQAGQAGDNGVGDTPVDPPGNGGAAGRCTDGESFITWMSTGTRAGPQVN